MKAFTGWWLKELSSLIPSPIRAWYQGKQNIFAIRLSEQQLSFIQPQGTVFREISTITLEADASRSPPQNNAFRQLQAMTKGKSHRLLLCLPAERVLRKTLRLPLAIEENLAQALEFELDRQTPFKLAQVYMAYKVIQRDTGNSQLVIELSVVKKEIVDRLIEQLSAQGLHVHAAVLEQDVLKLGNDCPSFLPHALRNNLSQRSLWINLVLGSILLLLLGGALAIPLWQKREAAIALNALAVEGKEQALRTQAMRAELETELTEHNFLLDKKTGTLSRFILINELSKLIPDDTWISQLDISETEIQLQGETGSPSKLVELMEGSDFLKATSSKSPLTKIPGTSVDRFHLSAELKQPVKKAKEKAAPAPVAGQVGTEATLPGEVAANPAVASDTAKPGTPPASIKSPPPASDKQPPQTAGKPPQPGKP